MLACRDGILARCQSGLRPCGTVWNIEFQPFHQREVDEYSAIGVTMSGEAVPAASHCEIDPMFPREVDYLRSVVRIGNLDDDCRAAVMEFAVEDGSCVVVSGITRFEHLTFDDSTKL